MKSAIDLMAKMMNMPTPWVIWLGLLIAANMVAPLFFITTLEAQIVIGTIMLSFITMTVVYASKGFVRAVRIAQ